MIGGDGMKLRKFRKQIGKEIEKESKNVVISKIREKNRQKDRSHNKRCHLNVKNDQRRDALNHFI